jgi:SAM-dependent methyltransferase
MISSITPILGWCEHSQNGSGCLVSRLWHGSFNGRESSLQQLSPYIGKMKSGMAHVLVDLFSRPGEVVLDPFCGSGVVPFEALLAGRHAWANDLNPYAYVLTRGKLEAPPDPDEALRRTETYLEIVEHDASAIDLDPVPAWVREFFHPRTLREIIAAFRLFTAEKDYFLIACLLGILHHQRPGFLSYPASHLVPYLRTRKFPADTYPEMYAYRDVRSRLLAKVRRAYRRARLPLNWKQREYLVWQQNAMALPIENDAVDAIISSPPYLGALDYARDNRLRLWFLGCESWKELDNSLTASMKVYTPQMSACLSEMHRVLKPQGYCVLVLGDVQENGRTRHTAEDVAKMAVTASHGGFTIDVIGDDHIPDRRRSRRRTRTTRCERIVVMCKE